MLLQNAFCIDLGTDTVKIYRRGAQEIQKEKNMIAIKDGKQVLAVGDAAYEMYEKAPENITVERSFKNARIADVAKVEYILHTLLRRIDPHLGYAPLLIFSAPCNMSEIEKRAYYAMSHAGKLNNPRVLLVDRALSDAIALGIPLTRTKGAMIVNLGAESTEFSIVANEQAMITKEIAFGGEQLNQAICDEVRRTHNLLIGMRSAELLRNALSTLSEETTEDALIVYGISTLSGLPASATVTQSQIRRAIIDLFADLAEEIRLFLTRIPPQYAASVMADGICLTGGIAKVPQIEVFLQNWIECRMRLSYDFDLCTIHGLMEIMEHKALQKYTYAIGKRSKR